MNEILLRTPATTSNVGPGYDIFALALQEPYDEMKISLNDSNNLSIEIIGNQQNIPTAIIDNTAGLAVLELFKRKQIQQGIHIQIIKKMVSSCGLGTTGASAAAAIFGLNKLLNLHLTTNEMIDFSRLGEVASGGTPHADNVAASILGGFVLVKSYHPLDVLKLEIPAFPVVLAVIRKSQRSTRGFISFDIGQDKLKEQMARCARVINSIHSGDIVEFGEAVSLDYIAEPVRGAAIPEYFAIKKKILESGALGCNICGGGSSVFAVCQENKIDEIAEIMRKSFSMNSNFVQIIKTKTCNIGVHEISG